MLTKRIIASLIVRNGIVVQSFGFKKYLPIGKPDVALEYLSKWDIDEIILLDISSRKLEKSPDFEFIRKAVSKCFVPLTIGGGLNSAGEIQKVLQSGADKVSFNNALINNHHLVQEASKLFGSQCVIASIDYLNVGGEFKVYDYLNKKILNQSLIDFALTAQGLGVGEIFINSVDRDGSYKGYEIEAVEKLCDSVDLPVISCGGAKNVSDFIQLFEKTNTSAGCASNLFHFTEHSVNMLKANIPSSIPIRKSHYVNYKENRFNSEFRLNKKKESDLENMLYRKIDKEVI